MRVVTEKTGVILPVTGCFDAVMFFTYLARTAFFSGKGSCGNHSALNKTAERTRFI